MLNRRELLTGSAALLVNACLAPARRPLERIANEEIATSGLVTPYVLMIGGEWCAPCKAVAIPLEELAARNLDVRFYHVEIMPNDPAKEAIEKRFKIGERFDGFGVPIIFVENGKTRYFSGFNDKDVSVQEYTENPLGGAYVPVKDILRRP